MKYWKPKKWIIIWHTPKFLKWWGKLNGMKVGGMTIPFVILLCNKMDDWDEFKNGNYFEKNYYEKLQRWIKRLINHESIHIHQQLELLIVFFFLLYGFEYLYHRIKGLDHLKAYRKISFEQEAYNYDDYLTYLKTRKPYHWTKYFLK